MVLLFLGVRSGDDPRPPRGDLDLLGGGDLLEGGDLRRSLGGSGEGEGRLCPRGGGGDREGGLRAVGDLDPPLLEARPRRDEDLCRGLSHI